MKCNLHICTHCNKHAAVVMPDNICVKLHVCIMVYAVQPGVVFCYIFGAQRQDNKRTLLIVLEELASTADTCFTAVGRF